MVLMSNQFLEDLAKLAAIYRQRQSENQEITTDDEKELNTQYSTVQQIEQDERRKQKFRI